MDFPVENLRELESNFRDYVSSYKKYLNLVSAYEDSLLDDFLEPCRELKYPSDNMHMPHIRKADRQFNKCKESIRSLLCELSQNLRRQFRQTNSGKRSKRKLHPIYSFIKEVYILIEGILVPGAEGDCVNTEARENRDTCDVLLEQVQELINTHKKSKSQERNKPRKDLNKKETKRNNRRPKVIKHNYFASSTTALRNQLTERFLKCLQHPSLTFPFLKWNWTQYIS